MPSVEELHRCALRANAVHEDDFSHEQVFGRLALELWSIGHHAIPYDIYHRI